MRTVFASVLLATVAFAQSQAPTPESAYQFVSGMFTTFEMDNSLDELAVCTTDAGADLQLAYQLVLDHKAGKNAKVARDIAALTAALPGTISDCQSMQDDVARLESWLSIFKDQTTLISTITKNILKHPVDLGKDIKKLEADLATPDYTAAGADATKIIELALGSVPKEMESLEIGIPDLPPITPEQLQALEFGFQFVQGLIGQFEIDESLDELAVCTSGAAALAPSIDTLLTDHMNGARNAKIAADIAAITAQLPGVLSGCKGMDEDLARLQAWLIPYEDMNELINQIVKNLGQHPVELGKSLKAVKTDVEAGDYTKAGQDAAAILEIALGPVPTQTLMEFTAPTPQQGYQFISGLLSAFEVNNSLDELAVCTSGASAAVPVAYQLYLDKTAGKSAKVAKDIAELTAMLPGILQGCKGMDDDLDRLKRWLIVYEDVEDLIGAITKNVMKYPIKLANDVKAVKTDLDNGDYTQAGADTADILQIALGPVPKEMELQTPTPEQGLQFISGLLTTFEIDNSLSELQVCTNDAAGALPVAYQLYQDKKAGKSAKVAKDIAELTAMLPGILADCQSMTEDVDRLKRYVESYATLEDFVGAVTKNIMKKPIELANDIKKLQTDLATPDFTLAGGDAAKIIELALGPIPQMMKELELMFELKSIPAFIAGFLNGMLGTDNLPEIGACHDGLTPIVSILHDFVNHLLSFDIFKAIGDLEKFIWNFQIDFLPCTAMHEDMEAIAAWGQQFTQPASLVPEITKNVVLHKRAITNLWADEQAQWSAGNYYVAGQDMAGIVTYAVGPIEPIEFYQTLFLQ